LKSTKDTIKLRPYGDVHWAALSCDRDKLIEFLSSDTPNSYYLSVGDDLNLIPHTDKRFRTTEIDRNFLGQIDKKGNPQSIFDAEVNDYIQIWKKYRIPPERHLGVLEGNHSLVMTSHGMNPIQHFCSQLSYPYLAEYSAVIPICFHISRHDSTRQLVIIAHHGWGGTNSRQKGADVNKYVMYSKGFDNFDIALYGHTHGYFVMPDIILDCATKAHYIQEKIILVGLCGTFLKTLEKGKGSNYSERAGMPARVISWLEIDIGFREDHNGNLHLKYPHIVPSS
jgi:hypothetical protein